MCRGLPSVVHTNLRGGPSVPFGPHPEAGLGHSSREVGGMGSAPGSTGCLGGAGRESGLGGSRNELLELLVNSLAAKGLRYEARTVVFDVLDFGHTGMSLLKMEGVEFFLDFFGAGRPQGDDGLSEDLCVLDRRRPGDMLTQVTRAPNRGGESQRRDHQQRGGGIPGDGVEILGPVFVRHRNEPLIFSKVESRDNESPPRLNSFGES